MNNIDSPWNDPKVFLQLNQILRMSDLVGGQTYLLIREMITNEIQVLVAWWQNQNEFFNGINGCFEDYMVFELPTNPKELEKQIEKIY